MNKTILQELTVSELQNYYETLTKRIKDLRDFNLELGRQNMRLVDQYSSIKRQIPQRNSHNNYDFDDIYYIGKEKMVNFMKESGQKIKDMTGYAGNLIKKITNSGEKQKIHQNNQNQDFNSCQTKQHPDFKMYPQQTKQLEKQEYISDDNDDDQYKIQYNPQKKQQKFSSQKSQIKTSKQEIIMKETKLDQQTKKNNQTQQLQVKNCKSSKNNNNFQNKKQLVVEQKHKDDKIGKDKKIEKQQKQINCQEKKNSSDIKNSNQIEKQSIQLKLGQNKQIQKSIKQQTKPK